MIKLVWIQKSLKMTRETLALLDIPIGHAKILPGHGWRPPEAEWTKINTDAGISSVAHMGGMGGVARSSTTFLGAWSKPCVGVTDPLVAEAMSVREGVIFAQLRGFARVVVETDSLEVVNLWNSCRPSLSVRAPVLIDIEGLASSFSCF